MMLNGVKVTITTESRQIVNTNNSHIQNRNFSDFTGGQHVDAEVTNRSLVSNKFLH